MSRRAVGWLAAGATTAVAGLAMVTEADPDLWGHLRFGLDLIASRRLTSIDPHSFTQDRPWINHEWLSELAMGLAYSAAGVAGLTMLKATLVVSALTLVWFAFRGVAFPARLAVMAALVIGTGPMTKTLRPQLWSLVCFVLLCRILAERRTSARLWLPLVFVVWANSHGGWVVGAGVLALWAAASTWANRRDAGSWAVTGAACAAATLCTPYGWQLWRFVWETVGLERDITEWQPLWHEPSIVWLVWIGAAAAAMWGVRPRDVDRVARTAVLLMLAYVSLRVERVAPFFIIGAALLTAPLVAQWPRREGQGPVLRSRQDAAVAVGLAVALAAVGVWLGVRSARCIALDASKPWTPDSEASRILAGAQPGRLVTPFDWGQYAIWHWGPALRVSMDGRRETVYSDARVREHDAIKAGTAEGLAVVDAWQPEYVWLPASSVRTRDWLQNHGYRIEAASARSFVAVRGDMPPLGAPVPVAAPSRCFPD